MPKKFRYQLEVSKAEAVERLRREARVRVLTAEEAARPQGDKPFLVIEDSSFRIAKGGSDLGPAVVGTLEDTPDGAVLDVELRPVSPTPSQREGLLAVGVVTLMVVAGLVAQLFQGISALGGLLVVGALGIFAGFMIARRRRQQERDLLAIVERTYGPIARITGDAPYRQRALPSAETPTD